MGALDRGLNMSLFCKGIGQGQVMATERLHPRIEISNKTYVVMIDRLAATDGKLLVETEYNAETIRDDITRAIDMIFTG